jgi:hypothetical protein
MPEPPQEMKFPLFGGSRTSKHRAEKDSFREDNGTAGMKQIP